MNKFRRSRLSSFLEKKTARVSPIGWEKKDYFLFLVLTLTCRRSQKLKLILVIFVGVKRRPRVSATVGEAETRRVENCPLNIYMPLLSFNICLRLENLEMRILKKS